MRVNDFTRGGTYMSKNNKRFFMVMGICIVTGIVIVLLIASLYVKSALEADYRERNYCTICHQHEKMRDKSYCYYCFEKAKLEEKKKESNGNSSYSNSPSSGTNSKTTSSSSKTTSSSSSKTTSGSSSKKEYNTLNYDPDDYDDPDDYAEDAWGEDFDDYDDAYDYWEDW